MASCGRRSAFVGVSFNVLLGAVEMVFAADGVIVFLFAWELMTLANAALVTTEHESAESRRAAFLYLVMSHVATGCLIAGFLLVSALTGSLSLLQIAGRTCSVGTDPRDLVFALFFVGFGVKAGRHPASRLAARGAPGGAQQRLRAHVGGDHQDRHLRPRARLRLRARDRRPCPGGSWSLLCGGVSAVLGVLYALMQHDLKRLLAYHSIENIGIILLGLGAGMMALASGRAELAAVGIAASLYHVLNHAVFKGLLFLGAGGVVMATGTRKIEHDGRPAEADAVDGRSSSSSARWPSPACRRSTASRASGSRSRPSCSGSMSRRKPSSASSSRWRARCWR